MTTTMMMMMTFDVVDVRPTIMGDSIECHCVAIDDHTTWVVQAFHYNGRLPLLLRRRYWYFRLSSEEKDI